MDIGREVGLPSSVDAYAGNGFRRDGRVCPEEAEYGHAIHHNATDYVPVKRDSKDVEGVGVNKVVVTGRPGPGRI